MLNKILNQLDQLSKEELLTLNSAVIKLAKAKDRVESVIKGATLNVGQVVTINHPKYKGQKFTIKKVNKTRCQISDGGHTIFTCPMNMIMA